MTADSEPGMRPVSMEIPGDVWEEVLDAARVAGVDPGQWLADTIVDALLTAPPQPQDDVPVWRVELTFVGYVRGCAQVDAAQLIKHELGVKPEGQRPSVQVHSVRTHPVRRRGDAGVLEATPQRWWDAVGRYDAPGERGTVVHRQFTEGREWVVVQRNLRVDRGEDLEFTGTPVFGLYSRVDVQPWDKPWTFHFGGGLDQQAMVDAIGGWVERMRDDPA